jgi:23S rRNA (pseudouridine1915-N3)-methyltransferase
MRLTFIWVGKTRNQHWAALEQEYLERIQHFAPSQVRVVRESKGAPVSGSMERAREQEGEAILKAVGPPVYMVLLDEQGTQLGSRELATFVAQRQRDGVKETAFVVGGATGVAGAVRRRADFQLSLSRMTFPHEMTRTIVLEQIYRAFAIIHNFPYPK